MKSWQERGRPYEGYGYDALTPHYFWDGKTHYWPGMVVRGTEDQNPDNPACCQDLAVFERGDVKLGPVELTLLRRGLRRRGHTHKDTAGRLGLGVSCVRSRLYGMIPFRRADFNVLCRLAGVDPTGLGRRGGEGEEGGEGE